MTKNSEYWEKRIASETWKVYNSLEEKNKELLQFYIEASESVKDELYRLAEKYSKDGVLSLSEMHKQNRLTELNRKFEKIIEELGHSVEHASKKNMQQGFKEVYTNVVINMDKIDFAMPNKKMMEKLLNAPWRGDSFSGRLWKNQRKLANALNDILLVGLQQGKTATEIAIKLHNRMGQGFNECHRLVRTETMHYLNDATLQRYKDANVKYVQILAAKDERTCEICGGYHEKVYPIEKCIHVPLHANCRCTILPVTDKKLISQYETNRKKNQEKIQNVFGEEIVFDERMIDTKWRESKDVLIQLTKQYKTRLRKVSVGNHRGQGSVDMGGHMRLASKKVSDAIHEFAHSIAMSNLTKYKVTDDSEFWKEIRKIRTKYRKSVSENIKCKISVYADTGGGSDNIDEFFAEAFAHAKTREFGFEIPDDYGSDFTYSQQVLNVTNKYFGKA